MQRNSKVLHKGLPEAVFEGCNVLEGILPNLHSMHYSKVNAHTK